MPNPPFAPPAPVSPTKPLTGRDLIISQYKDPSLMTEEEVRKEFNALEKLPYHSFRESVRSDQINKYLKKHQWDEASDLGREVEAQRQSDIAIRELGNKQIDAIESTFRQANPDSTLSREQVKDSYIKEYGKDYLSQLGYSPVWGEEDQRKRRDQAELLAGEWSDPEEDLVKPGFWERRESDLGKGWNQMEVAWNSVGALAFDKIGADDWAESWALDAEYDRAESAEHAKTGLQTSYFGHGPKPEGILGFGEWAAGSLTELLPMVGEVAAQAGIGTLLATPGPGTVAGATSGIVFRQASRKALADATGKVLAKREALTAGTRGSLQTFLKTGNYDHLTDDALRALGDDASLAAGTVRGAEKKAIEDRLKGLGLKLESDSAQALFGHHYTAQRRVWGSTAGAFSATAPLETGGALSDYAQQMGIPVNEIDLWTGLKISAAGGVAGAADAIFPFMAANRIFARPVKAAILQSKWQKAKPVIKGMLQGSSIEGGTEIFQEAVTTAAVREAKGLDAWDFTDDEKSHMWEAGAKGAIGGLFFPAVISTARRALKWSGSKMGMTEGESVAATPSEVLSRALAKQDSEVNEMLDPEHIVPSPAASTESSELLDEGDSIPVSVAREPSHEQKIAIKQLVIKEASETITEEAAAEERARLLTDQADKDFYKKTSTEVVSALAHKRKKEVEALALRAAQSNNLSEEENAALDDEVAKLSTTDKALFNKVRLDLLNRKARGEQNMDGMTKEDLLYENAPIKERREFLAAVGQRIANEPKKSLDELRAEAKTKLEKDLIDLIIEFESSDQTTTDEYMDLVLPSVASSPMQEGLAQYIWTAHTEEAAEHMVRMEDAVEESKVNTGSNKAWTDHIAGVLEKWVARAVDEVTPADIKLWQLDPRNRDSLTEPEAQALNTAQARLISEEGQTEETLTAAQVVRKANEILALERKQAAAINEKIAADNPTVNKAIDKVKKAPKAKKPAAPEVAEETTEETTEETAEETVEGAVTKKAKKAARDEAVNREIEAALEATDDPHKRIEHLFRARQIVKRANGRLNPTQKKAIEGMEEGLKAEGYTWESLDGKEVHDGDAINPTYIPENTKAGARLAHLRKRDGEHGVVSETLTPEIRKDGKMSKVADVKVVVFGEITEVESLQRRIDSLTEKIERPSRAGMTKLKAGLTESRDKLQKELDEKVAEKPIEEKVKVIEVEESPGFWEGVEKEVLEAKEKFPAPEDVAEGKPVEEKVVAEAPKRTPKKWQDSQGYVKGYITAAGHFEQASQHDTAVDNLVGNEQQQKWVGESGTSPMAEMLKQGAVLVDNGLIYDKKGVPKGVPTKLSLIALNESTLANALDYIDAHTKGGLKAWKHGFEVTLTEGGSRTVTVDPVTREITVEGEVVEKPVETEAVAEEDKIPTLYYGTTNQEIRDTVSIDLDNIVSKGRGTGFQAEGAGRYASAVREAAEWYQRGEEEKGGKGAKEGLLYEYDANISESSVLDQSAEGIENQPEVVQKAWQAYLDLLNQNPKGNKKRLEKIKKRSAGWLGYHFYGEIADYFVKTEGKSSKAGSTSKEDIYMAQVKASRFLRDNGVDAMSYSRKGKGTASKKTYKNYVILNTDKITVKKVYDHEGNVVHDASTAEVAVEEEVVEEEVVEEEVGGGFVLDDSPQQKNLEMRKEELKSVEEELEEWEGKLEDAEADLEVAESEHQELEKKVSKQKKQKKAGESLGAAANTRWSKDPANALSDLKGQLAKGKPASNVAMKVHELSGAKSSKQIKETAGKYKGKGYAPATKELVDPPQGKHFGIKALVYELLRIEGAAAPSEVVMLSELDDKGGIQLEIDGVAGIELTAERLSGERMTVRLEKIWSIEKGGAAKAGRKLVAAANASGVTIVGTASPFTNPKTEKIEMTEKRLINFYEKMGATVDENGNATIKPDVKKGERAATKRLKGEVKAKQEYILETQDEISEAESNVDNLEGEKYTTIDEIDGLEAEIKALKQAVEIVSAVEEVKVSEKAAKPTEQAEEATAPAAAPAPATVEKVAKGEVKTVGPADTSQKLAKEWETKSIHMTLVENLADIAQEGLHPRPQINEEMKALIDKGDITRDQAVLFSKHFLFYLQPHPLSTWNSKLEYHIRHVVASTQGKGMRLDEGPMTEAYSERMKKDQMVVLGFREPGESQQDMSMEDYIEVALDSGASPSPAVEKELGAELSRMTFEPVGAEDISVWTDNGWVPIADYVKGKNIGAVAEVAVEEEAVEEEAVEEKAVEPKAKAKPKPKRKPTKAEEQKKKEKKIAAIEAQITKIQAEQADITLSVEEEASLKPLTDAEVTDTAQKLADRAEVAEEDGEVVQFKDDGNTMADRMEFLAQQLDEGVAEPNDAGMKARMQMVNELLGVIDEDGGDVEAFDLNELARLQKEYDRLRKSSKRAKGAPRSKISDMPEELQVLRKELIKALRNGSEGIKGTLYANNSGDVFYNPEEPTSPTDDFGVRANNYILIRSSAGSVSGSVAKLAEALDEQYTLPPAGEYVHMSNSMIFGDGVDVSTDPESGQAVPQRKRKVEASKTRQARESKKKTTETKRKIFKDAKPGTAINPNPTTKVEEAKVIERVLDDQQINWIAQNVVDEADLGYEGVDTVQKRGKLITQLGTDIVHRITHNDGSVKNIADYYGVSEDLILERNDMSHASEIMPGSRLIIPAPPLDWWTAGDTLTQFVKSSGAMAVGVTAQGGKRRNVGRRALFLRDTETGLIHLSSVFFGKHLQIEDPTTGNIRKKDVSEAGFVRPKVDKDTLEFIEGSNKYEIVSLVRLRKKTGVGNIFEEYGKDMPPLNQGDYNALMRLLDVVANEEHRAKESTKRTKGETSWASAEGVISPEGVMIMDPKSYNHDATSFGVASSMEADRIPSISGNQTQAGSIFLAKLFYSMRRDRADRGSLKGTKAASLAQMDKETVLRELSYFYTKNPDILKDHLEEVYSNYIDEIKMEGLDAGRSWPEIMADIQSQLPDHKPRTEKEWFQMSNIAIPVVGEIVHQRLAHEGDTDLSYFTADYAEIKRTQQLDEGLQGGLSASSKKAVASHRQRETWNTSAQRRAVALTQTGVEQISIAGVTDRALGVLKENYALQIAGMEIGEGTINGSPMALWELANTLERDNRPATNSPKIGDNKKAIRIFNERVWASIKTAVERFIREDVSSDPTTERHSSIVRKESPFGYMAAAQVQERFQFLSNVAGQYGIPVNIEEGPIESGQISMSRDNPESSIITLAMHDAAQPTANNIDNLLEELAHHVFYQLDSKQKHQLLLSINAGASNYFSTSLAKLSPAERESVLKEEELVRSVLDSIANNRELDIAEEEAATGVKALIKALMQYLKEAYDRIVMAVQGENVNPDVAERFLKRRMMAFLSGRPMPNNIFQALNLKMPEDRAKGFTQVNPEQVAARLDPSSGNYVYSAVLPDSPHATEFNIMNSTRPQDSRMSAGDTAILLAEKDFDALTEAQKNEIIQYAFENYLELGIKLRARTKNGITESEEAGVPSRLDGADWRIVRTELFRRWGGQWLSSPEDSHVLLDPATKEPIKIWHVTPALAVEGPIALEGTNSARPDSRYKLPFSELSEFSWAISDRSVALNDYAGAHPDWANARKQLTRHGQTSRSAPIVFGGFARAEKVLKLHSVVNSTEGFVALLEDSGIDLSPVGGAAAVIGSMNATQEGAVPAFLYVNDLLELARDGDSSLASSKLLKLIREQGFGAISVQHPFEDATAYLLLEGGAQLKATTMQDWRDRSVEKSEMTFSESRDVRYSSTAPESGLNISREIDPARKEESWARINSHLADREMNEELGNAGNALDALKIISETSKNHAHKHVASSLIKADEVDAKWDRDHAITREYRHGLANIEVLEGGREARRRYAERLSELGLNESEQYSMPDIDGGSMLGVYDAVTNIVAARNLKNEHVLLHEIVHAGTIRSVTAALYQNGLAESATAALDEFAFYPDHVKSDEEVRSIVSKLRESDNARDHGVADIFELYQSVLNENFEMVAEGEGVSRRDKSDSGDADMYGMKNVLEFISEGYSSSRFQNFLRQHKIKNDKPTMWSRFVTAVSVTLGIETSTERTALQEFEEAMERIISFSESDVDIIEGAKQPERRAIIRQAKQDLGTPDSPIPFASRDVRYSPARIKDINKPASLDVQQENVAAVDIAASNFVLQEVIDVVWDGSPAAQKLFESKDKMSALYAAIIKKAVEASKEVGATVSPDITIADLDGESRQNASRTALELLDQLRAKVSVDAAEASRDLNRSIDAAVKKDQKLSELERSYKDLTWNMSEMWSDFRGMVKELNKTVTGSVKHGKDASKLSQLLGKLEGELDSPISKNQLTLINKVLRREYGRPYGNFNTLVDKLSQFGDEIAFGRLANEEPAAAARRVSAAIQSKSIEMAAAPELANIMAAFMVANPLHVNLMQLRKLTVEEGRDDIIAELEAIRLGSPKTTKELEDQARATVKNGKLLTRLMIEVNKMKRDSKKATEQANTLQNTIDMGNEAAPSLLQARIHLEDELGIQVQFNLKDGSTLYVPVDKNTYPTNVKDQENQVVYFKETYKNHDADMRKMTAWLLNQKSYARGTDYRLVMQQRDSLLRDFTRNVLDVETHYGSIGLFSKIWRASRLIPITDRMRLIGLHEGVDMVKMFSEYGQLSQLAKDLHKKGQKVTAAMHAAMEAVEEGNEETFFSTYYDQALKHIENNKDQLANLNDEGQVLKGIEMLKKYYASHANTATARASAKGWSELKKFFKMSVTANMALRDYISNLSEGALVEDEIAGEKIYRGLIGNVWTVARGFNEKAVSTINSMSAIWSETNSPFRNQRYNFAEDYAKNPDKFREEMAKFFTPGKLGSRVLNDFVGPILNKGGASLFLEPLVEGKLHRAAAQKTDIQEAWGKSGGDVVTFAEALWATTTSEVTEDQVSTPLDAYVGEVMQVFSSFYQNMYKSINESNNSWTGQAAPRDLMDARETESYPSEFMEFNRLDRLRIAAVANRAAMHSAFGRDFEGFQSMWDQAKRRADAINVLREELKEKAESTGKSIPVLLKEAQSSEEVWSSLTPTKLKNAERVVEDLAQIKHEFKGWINLASGRTLDDTVLMEVIGAVAGNAVQGVKTIVNDTSTLVFSQIMNMGLNAHGTRALWETGKHFIGQTGNTLLNAAYRDFRIGFEFDALANKYGAVDGTASDLYGQLTQVMNSASSNLEIMSAERNRPIPQGANKLQRGLVKFARTLSASKEMGMGQAREGEQDAPTDIVLQPLGPFGTFAMIGQMSAAHGMANTAAYFVLRGAEYYAKNPSYKGEITQEMLGGWEGVAPDKAIMFMREQMALHGGMDMDAMARKAGEEIRNKGKVTPFIDAEFLRLMYLSAQSNITGEATFSSRPSYFLTSTTGRIINPLFGWAINQAYKSTFKWNRNEDMSKMEGASSKLKYYFLPMVGALGYVTVMAMLRDELEEEVLGVKQRGIDPLSWRGMVDAVDRVGMFGMFGSVANEAINTESSRTWSIENRVLLINTTKQLFNLTFRLHQTGYNMNYENLWRPMIQLMGGGGYLQYGQILNNAFSLDNAEARYSARLNAKNAIISAGKELKMDIKKGGGGWAPTPVTPYVTQMEIAAMANDSNRFRAARQSAIEKAMVLRNESRHEAEKYVDTRFASNHPMRKAFKAYPTSKDISKLYDQMSDESEGDVKEAVRLYNHYLEQLGRGGFKGSGLSGKKQVDPLAIPQRGGSRQRNRDKEMLDKLLNR